MATEDSIPALREVLEFAEAKLDEGTYLRVANALKEGAKPPAPGPREIRTVYPIGMTVALTTRQTGDRVLITVRSKTVVRRGVESVTTVQARWTVSSGGRIKQDLGFMDYDMEDFVSLWATYISDYGVSRIERSMDAIEGEQVFRGFAKWIKFSTRNSNSTNPFHLPDDEDDEFDLMTNQRFHIRKLFGLVAATAGN